ncbi:MAG: nucleoside transporter C-terminal domain-containing protein [Bacteroidales bacterium]|nr:nucleoside transporter C-terminal domain-containing protein [Bacteroidales bacterium]
MQKKLILIAGLLFMAGLSLMAQGTAESIDAESVSMGFSFTAILRGLLGIAILLGLSFLISSKRRAINWKVVGTGLAVQFIIAIIVLKVPIFMHLIEIMGSIFLKILDFTQEGTAFLLQSFISDKVESPMINFAFWVLPTIIFFSALTSILFYYGIIQKVVYVMAWLLKKALGISGAESLSATANIFLGQTESPLMIKEYLKKMNRSEIMLVMTGGMATIAGGVMAIYIGMLGGTDPVNQLLFAKHLITASVMAAPGAVVAAKLLVPQTEAIQSEIRITRESIGSNVLDAISNGTQQGIKLLVNVAAMLLVFIALIAMLNFVLLKVGDWTSLNEMIISITGGQYEGLTMQFLLGYALAPLMLAVGVSPEDMTLVGQLFGEKIILNELIAYKSLKDLIVVNAFSSEKSMIMATYMLCGFANFSSIGIQIGGIGALAPNRRVMLSQLGMRAMIGGALASLFSATMVGMILG